MDFERVIEYCKQKEGISIEFPFDDKTMTIKINNKMFILLALDSRPQYINLKCDPALSEILRKKYNEITPGYHMNKTHWNTVRIDGNIEDSELFKMIDHSFDLVNKRGRKR